MSKHDDDDPKRSGYDWGDMLAGAAVAVTAVAAFAAAVEEWRERRARRERERAASAPPAPPFEVEDRAGAATGDDVPRAVEGCN